MGKTLFLQKRIKFSMMPEALYTLSIYQPCLETAWEKANQSMYVDYRLQPSCRQARCPAPRELYRIFTPNWLEGARSGTYAVLLALKSVLRWLHGVYLASQATSAGRIGLTCTFSPLNADGAVFKRLWELARYLCETFRGLRTPLCRLLQEAGVLFPGQKASGRELSSVMLSILF